jgi:hypothetical protein
MNYKPQSIQIQLLFHKWRIKEEIHMNNNTNFYLGLKYKLFIKL